MARPTTKDSLLAASEDGLAALLETIDSISLDHRNDDFPFPGRDRTIRDVICHLHEWHLMVLDWYEVGMGGAKPEMPAPGYTWRTTPDLNKKLWEGFQDTPLDEALERVKESHSRIHDLILSHTDEELFTKKYYPWTGSTSLGAYFVSATSSHYDWAKKKIVKLKRSL